MRRTAIVYDPFNLRHTLDGHPENHRRLKSTMELLQDEGMLERLISVPSAPAPLDAILAVHSPAYLERLQAITGRGGGHLDADTYVNADSYEAALRSAGSRSIWWMRWRRTRPTTASPWCGPPAIMP